jgi:hypothetical protein
VQQIEDEFTIKVHEESAFFASQHCDYIQFNECITKLMELYRKLPSPRKTHFLACRMLQFVFDGNSAELWQLIQSLKAEQRGSAEIRLCFEIVEAINTGNYELILRLSTSCPSVYVKGMVRMFLGPIRNSALLLFATT